MRLPPHETGFDLANSVHPDRYRDNALLDTPPLAAGQVFHIVTTGIAGTILPEPSNLACS
jgi:hypothetical protein